MIQKKGDLLRKGDFIIHKNLDLCLIHDVNRTTTGNWFGIIIKPLTIKGINTLQYWSKTNFNTMLEHSIRSIISKIESPVIPKLILQTNRGYEVHKWKKLGEISTEGKISSVKLKSFKNIEDAIKYQQI
jgi:hypothetical protein